MAPARCEGADDTAHARRIPNPAQKADCDRPACRCRTNQLAREITRGVKLAVQHDCALERVEGKRTSAYRHQPGRSRPTIGIERSYRANPMPFWPTPRPDQTGMQAPTRTSDAGCQNQQAREANDPIQGKIAATRKEGLTEHPNLLYKFGYDGAIGTQRQNRCCELCHHGTSAPPIVSSATREKGRASVKLRATGQLRDRLFDPSRPQIA